MSATAQQARMQKVKHAPEIFGRIFQRRTGQHHFVQSLEHLAAVSIGSTGIFDMLRFVKYQQPAFFYQLQRGFQIIVMYGFCFFIISLYE